MRQAGWLVLPSRRIFLLFACGLPFFLSSSSVHDSVAFHSRWPIYRSMRYPQVKPWQIFLSSMLYPSSLDENLTHIKSGRTLFRINGGIISSRHIFLRSVRHGARWYLAGNFRSRRGSPPRHPAGPATGRKVRYLTEYTTSNRSQATTNRSPAIDDQFKLFSVT